MYLLYVHTSQGKVENRRLIFIIFNHELGMLTLLRELCLSAARTALKIQTYRQEIAEDLDANGADLPKVLALVQAVV